MTSTEDGMDYLVIVALYPGAGELQKVLEALQREGDPFEVLGPPSTFEALTLHAPSEIAAQNLAARANALCEALYPGIPRIVDWKASDPEAPD